MNINGLLVCNNLINKNNFLKNTTKACSTIYAKFGYNIYSGSGCFITKDGWFLTAAHMVINLHRNDSADKVFICSPKTKKWIASTNFYVDAFADIALVKINETNLPFIKIANSNIQIRDECYLCGDPLGVDTTSISKGIVRDNHYTDTDGVSQIDNILIDTPGFSGNSGSPILNVRGKIIGLYTFGFTGSESLGGGANWNTLQSVIPILKKKQNYTIKKYLGITYSIPSPFTLETKYNKKSFLNRGIVINKIKNKSPFKKSKMKVGDILLKINTIEIGSMTHQRSPGVFMYKNNSKIKIIYYDVSQSKKITEIIDFNVKFNNVNVSEDAPLSGGYSNKIKLIKGIKK